MTERVFMRVSWAVVSVIGIAVVCLLPQSKEGEPNQKPSHYQRNQSTER